MSKTPGVKIKETDHIPPFEKKGYVLLPRKRSDNRWRVYSNMAKLWEENPLRYTEHTVLTDMFLERCQLVWVMPSVDTEEIVFGYFKGEVPSAHEILNADARTPKRSFTKFSGVADELPYVYEGGDCWDESGESILYEISINEILYWVSSLTPDNALRLVLREECEDDFEKEPVTVRIQPCTNERAQECEFIDEDNPDPVTMWDEFNRDPSERVIASSKWGS